jgi:zeta-carotene desaturase
MSESPKIIIVGGGVASFVAALTLHERLPRAQIKILSAADEDHLGGQLASWDEGGYPIEHGLHALFGFYENIIPILKKVGAYDNFTRSRKYTFVYERGKLHRFDLKTWLATYSGFTAREKLG